MDLKELIKFVQENGVVVYLEVNGNWKHYFNGWLLHMGDVNKSYLLMMSNTNLIKLLIYYNNLQQDNYGNLSNYTVITKMN